MKENIPLHKNEEIRSIIGYEGLYSITSFGRVWSHAKKRNNRYEGGRFLILHFSKKKYLQVGLSKLNKQKSYRVHRLVAQHYIPNPNNLPEVNHRDGEKQNNHKDNLEWCTSQDNNIHAIRNGLKSKILSKFYGVSYSQEKRRTKRWRAFVREGNKTKTLGRFFTEIEAAIAYNKYCLKNNLNRALNNLGCRI